MNMFYKNLSMWLVIGLTMVLLFNLFNKPQSTVTEMSYSDFVSSVESGMVNQVVIQGNEADWRFDCVDLPENPSLEPAEPHRHVALFAKQSFSFPITGSVRQKVVQAGHDRFAL